MKNKKIKINMKCVPIELWAEYHQIRLIMILLGAKTEEELGHFVWKELFNGEVTNGTL